MIFKYLLLLLFVTFASCEDEDVTSLPHWPEYDDYWDPSLLREVPTTLNASDSNEDERIEEFFTDSQKDENENMTLSEQWPENDDDSSSSFLPDPTISDDVDSIENDHLQESFKNPQKDENKEVSSSPLRPENESLQESFTNPQKDLNSIPQLSENEGYREPKHIPIPKVDDFTPEELEAMVAKVNEFTRILDANKGKLENDRPQESLTNPLKDENEEVSSSPPWPENDEMASRMESDSTDSDYFYDDVEDYEVENLVKTPTNPQKDPSQDWVKVFLLSLFAFFASIGLLSWFCSIRSNKKQGGYDMEEQNNSDIIEKEATVMKSVKSSELPIEKKQALIVQVQDEFDKLKRKSNHTGKSSTNLRNENERSGYGKQSRTSVSIGSVALEAARLAAELSSDNNEEGEVANTEAVGPPATNFGSLPRMRVGCASRLSNRLSNSGNLKAKGLGRLSDASSGIGDSVMTIQTISSRVDLQDKAEFEKSKNPFSRNSEMRRSKSYSDINKAEAKQYLEMGAIANDVGIKRGKLRRSRPLSQFVHLETLKEVKAEVHRSSAESSPELTKKQVAIKNSTDQ